MALDVKICGVRSAAAVEAAARGGARYVGLVFYPPSPRFVDTGTADALGRQARGLGLAPVGVFVDPDDSVLERATGAVDHIQLHGSEPPERVAEIGRRFETPIIKAIKVAAAGDIAQAARYSGAADMLLFDARAPEGAVLPGGNGAPFDWRLLSGVALGLPWMLSGGLTADNLADAVRYSGARALDVSSGVERAPGLKDERLIAAFLDRAKEIAAAEEERA